MVAGVLAAVAALAVTLVIALAIPGPTSSHGCIYVTFAGPTGAEQIHQCGASARATCRSAVVPGGVGSGPAMVAACRQAGLLNRR